MSSYKLAGTIVASTFSVMFLISPLQAQSLGGTTSTVTQETPKSDAPAKIDKSRLPPVATYQIMLDANKKSGWVAFRKFGGKQSIYFSPLQTLHCRLKEIRYSINSKELDQRFNLVKCNPYLPFSLPENSGADDIRIVVPAGNAKTVAVQVVWEDDRESEVVVYGPCPGVGGRTCATIVE